MRWTDTAKKFLGAVASKDIETMAYILSEQVRMTCWSCDTIGIDKTIESFENFFDFVSDIRVHIMNTAYHNKYVCVEIEVTYIAANKGKVLSNLVYILEFNDVGKIKLMRIYRMNINEGDSK